MRRFCESERGEWGKRCPDCGVTLPPRPAPMTTWQAQRGGDWPNALTDRKWSPKERENRVRLHQARATERLQEIVRIVAKNGGNRNAAARELGVSAPTVFAALRRAQAAGLSVAAPA